MSTRSSPGCSATSWSLLLAHHLLARHGQRLGHAQAQAVLGHRDAAALEVGQHLLDDVVVAGLLEIGGDYGLGVGIGLAGRDAELAGNPQAEDLVGAHLDLELELLVVLVLLLEALFPILEDRHSDRLLTGAPPCIWPQTQARQGYIGSAGRIEPLSFSSRAACAAW